MDPPKPTTKWYTPIPPPSDPQNGAQDPRGHLEPHEEELYDQVVAHFTRKGYVLPELEGEAGELTEKEKFWLSRECLLRYLRASKWNTHVAAQKLEFTLKWRREYGLYDTLTASSVEPEAVTGKHVFFGYDVERRPAFYAFPSRQNTEGVEDHVKFAFWMVERGIELMGPGVETLHILLNFAERSSKPSYTEATSLIHIMQSHYPERLGLCSISNLPFLIAAFLKLVLPFLDPATRAKMKFNQPVVKAGLFERGMLMREWEGGEAEFEYVHERYWGRLLEVCEGNAGRWMRRWRELGGRVGVREWEYKQGGEEMVEDGKEAVGVGKDVVSGDTVAKIVTLGASSAPDVPPKEGQANGNAIAPLHDRKARPRLSGSSKASVSKASVSGSSKARLSVSSKSSIPFPSKAITSSPPKASIPFPPSKPNGAPASPASGTVALKSH